MLLEALQTSKTIQMLVVKLGLQGWTNAGMFGAAFQGPKSAHCKPSNDFVAETMVLRFYSFDEFREQTRW